MKNSLTITLCSIAIFVFGCSTADKRNSVTKEKSDAIVLQGTWSGQEVGGNPQGSPSITFDGTKLEFYGANPQEWYKATFILREDVTPKQLEAVVTECPAPQYVGKTTHAIYKIEDDKFTLTANEPGNPAVPASFDAPESRQIVFKLK